MSLYSISFWGYFNSISIWYSMSCQEKFVLAPFLRLASNNKILSNPTLKITFFFAQPFMFAYLSSKKVAPLQLKVVPRTNIVVEEPSVCTTFRLNNNDLHGEKIESTGRKLLFVYLFFGCSRWGKKTRGRYLFQKNTVVHPWKPTWIPEMMVWKKVTPFKHGHFGYLC